MNEATTLGERVRLAIAVRRLVAAPPAVPLLESACMGREHAVVAGVAARVAEAFAMVRGVVGRRRGRALAFHKQFAIVGRGGLRHGITAACEPARRLPLMA